MISQKYNDIGSTVLIGTHTHVPGLLDEESCLQVAKFELFHVQSLEAGALSG